MMNKLVSPTGKPITLRPIRSNARIEAIYRKKLMNLVKEMNDSILYWLSASYKEYDKQIAQDANPFKALQKTMRDLANRWLKNLKVGAEKLAEWHAKQTLNMTDVQLKDALKQAGFSVPFTMTESMQAVFDANKAEQVNLITNMSVNHLAQIETLVTQSVQTGRDLATLTEELKTRFNMTERRAKLIARDQNNKASQLITRQRQQDLGITQAIWMHSHAGKAPRQSHVKADGKPYDLDKGMFLDGKWTFPSVEINCRCFSRPVIAGFID
jgi:SPP1 gp7 family putative phage head morphogenesis protein